MKLLLLELWCWAHGALPWLLLVGAVACVAHEALRGRRSLDFDE